MGWFNYGIIIITDKLFHRQNETINGGGVANIAVIADDASPNGSNTPGMAAPLQSAGPYDPPRPQPGPSAPYGRNSSSLQREPIYEEPWAGKAKNGGKHPAT